MVNGAYTAPVVAAGPDDDPPWLATVFVPGPSLAEAVNRRAVASCVRLAAGRWAGRGAAAVHACGLVHRDLKPANVLLALDGPRVIDFGISRALEKTTVTSTGMIVGTPSYMSPEQAEGSRVGAPSDVFSLGCVIVFAATGTGPFGHGPQASLLYRVVHSDPVITEVPGGLRGLAASCLAKRPADRPTLAELQAAIAAGRAPDDGDALASFWPVAVTGLIRSHQVRLTTELRETPAGPAPAAGPGPRTRAPGDLDGTAGRTAPAGHTALAATTALAGSTAQAAGSTAPAAGSTALAAGTTAHAGGTTAAAGPTSTGLAEAGTGGLAAGTVTAPTARSGPGLPADQVLGAIPSTGGPSTGGPGTGGPGTGGPSTSGPGTAGPSPAGPGLTRRRLLLGLAVLTGAGLGGAGWVLSQDSAPHHPQAGLHPGSHGHDRPRGVPAARGQRHQPVGQRGRGGRGPRTLELRHRRDGDRAGAGRRHGVRGQHRREGVRAACQRWPCPLALPDRQCGAVANRGGRRPGVRGQQRRQGVRPAGQ